VIFPFTLFAYDNTPHYVSSEYKFRPVFLQNKPEGLSWYCYNVVVKSPTEVTFVHYGMLDNFSGGIGKLQGEFDAVVSAELTLPFIQKQAKLKAEWLRAQELAKAEQDIINGYYEQIMASIV
jgi:hypothetical protein